MVYQHILFAADLIDEDDEPVSRKALELKKMNNSAISIVHAVEIPTGYGDSYEMPVVSQWQKDLEASLMGRLESLAEKIDVDKGNIHLKIGPPKNLILEVAQEIGADLIVVGSHGRHGLSLMLLGSTSTAVLHGAKCDVLAVRV